MADLEFKVAKRRKQALTFTLEGQDHVYKFDAPKQAVIFMPFLTGSEGVAELDMVRATFNWLSDGLSDEDVQRILDRLNDPEDDLDFPTVSDVIRGITEKIGGRPTT